MKNTQHDSYAIRETEISIKRIVYKTLNQFSGTTRTTLLFTRAAANIWSHVRLRSSEITMFFLSLPIETLAKVFKYLSYENFYMLHDFSTSNFETYSYKNSLRKKRMFYIKIAHIEINKHHFEYLLWLR